MKQEVEFLDIAKEIQKEVYLKGKYVLQLIIG
jgi:hypothetical protein